MSIINQDITSKKLLLIYCIDNMRDEFERKGLLLCICS